MPRFIKINIIFWVLFFVTVPASSELYQYTDKNGIMRLTNDIYSVPPEYRSQLAAFSELESISNEMDIQPLENKSLPQAQADKAQAEKVIAPKTPKALSADTGTTAIPPTAPVTEVKKTAPGPEEKAAAPFQPVYSEKPLKEPPPAAAVTAPHKSKKIAISNPADSKDKIDKPIHKIDEANKIVKTDKIDNTDIKAEAAEKVETDKTVKADYEPDKTDEIDEINNKPSSRKTATAAPEKNTIEKTRQAEPGKEVLQTQITAKDQAADDIPPTPVPVKITKTKKEIHPNQAAAVSNATAEPKTAKIATESPGTPEKAMIKPAEPEKKEKTAAETKTVKKESPDNTPPRQIAAATGKPVETPKTTIPTDAVAVKKTPPDSQVPTATTGAADNTKTASDTARKVKTPIISKETVSSESAAAAPAELMEKNKTTLPKASRPKEVAATLPANNLPVPAPKTVLEPGSESKTIKKEASEKITAEIAAQKPESRPETKKTIQPGPLPADTQTVADVKTVQTVVKTETPKKITEARKPPPEINNAALNVQDTPLPDKTSIAATKAQMPALNNPEKTPTAELSRRTIADDESNAVKMTVQPEDNAETAGIKNAEQRNVVIAKKENSSPDHDDEAMKLAKLETTRARLAEKKEALNKKYLSLMKEKQEIENSVDEEDEKSVLKYNESVKKLNFKIKQYKIAKKRLQAEIEKYNNTIKQSALN